MVFYATILHCKAMLGQGQPGLNKMIFLWIMPLVQDRITWHVDQQSSMLPLYHGCPLTLRFCGFISVGRIEKDSQPLTNMSTLDKQISSHLNIHNVLENKTIFPASNTLIAARKLWINCWTNKKLRYKTYDLRNCFTNLSQLSGTTRWWWRCRGWTRESGVQRTGFITFLLLLFFQRQCNSWK